MRNEQLAFAVIIKTKFGKRFLHQPPKRGKNMVTAWTLAGARLYMKSSNAIQDLEKCEKKGYNGHVHTVILSYEI